MVEPRVRVHMRGGIDEGTGVTRDFGVVGFAIDELLDLLHVCNPVDLCVLTHTLGWSVTVRLVGPGKKAYKGF